MHFFKRFGRKAALSVVSCGLLFTLSSCQLAKNQFDYDRAAEMSRQDFRDGLSPAPFADVTEAAIPEFEPVLSTPQELRLPSPLVTVSVNQTVGLRDLLFELTEQADVDLELDPQIRGSIIFTAKDRPFDEVVERICDVAGLRYTFKNGVLRVELDRPYIVNYRVDYLNIGRSGGSTVDTSVTMGGTATQSEVGSTSGGSTSNIKTAFDGLMWEELEASVEQILTSSDTYISLATQSDPVSMPINPMPPPLPVNPDDPSQPAPPPLPGSAAVGAMPAAASPTLNISPALSSDPVVPNPPATYSLSRQSGTLSVFSSARQHEQVAAFLKEFRKRTMTQVLIEAKVLQVELTDEYSAGIQWDALDITGLSWVQPFFGQPALAPAAVGNFQAVFETGDFQAVLQAVSRFGSVRALSSPRVTVLNNQPAVVNVTQDNVYFTYEVETEEDQDTNVRRVNITSTQESSPEGVLLNVLPSANADTGEITLSVRPTVSKITGRITDPVLPFTLTTLGIDPTTANVPDNQIPEVLVQEIDSMLKMQSGQILVLGGLMKDENIVEQESVPILGDLPFIGAAFGNTRDRIVKSELLILLRAQIVPGSNLDAMDRKLYKDFSLDRRPAPL